MAACFWPCAARIWAAFWPSALLIGGLPLALGLQDDGALVAVGAHLLLHRVLDRRRRIDGLELDPGDPDAPPAGRLVEHAAQLAVDLVAGGQRLLEVHPTDHVAQRGDRQLLDGLDVVGDLVRRRPRVGHLEIDDRVDVDGQVVLGDHRLRRERHHLLAQVDRGRTLSMNGTRIAMPGGSTRVKRPSRSTTAGSRLRNDPDRFRDDDHGQQYDHDQRDKSGNAHLQPQPHASSPCIRHGYLSTRA